MKGKQVIGIHWVELRGRSVDMKVNKGISKSINLSTFSYASDMDVEYSTTITSAGRGKSYIWDACGVSR